VDGIRASPRTSAVRRSTSAGVPAGNGPRPGSDTVEANDHVVVLGGDEVSTARRGIQLSWEVVE
jgi:hypothetical protein